MIRHILFIGWCLFFLVQGVAAAEEIMVEIEGRYWMTQLTAEAKVVRDNLGTDVNLKSDLGLEDKSWPYGRLNFWLNPSNRFQFVFSRFNYQADKILERDIRFAGETFPAGTRAAGNLDVNYMRIGWTSQFINMEGGRIKFGPLLEAKGFWGEVGVEGESLGVSIKESKTFSTWLPSVGLALDIQPIPWLTFFGEISGMPAGQYGHFFDAEVGVKVIPIKYFSLTGGYRYFNVEGQDDPSYAKVSLSGPYLGLSLRF